jgi:cholesterol transport system auxiliary component
MRRLAVFFLVLVTGLLSACGSAPRSTVTVYDFGLPAARLAGAEGSSGGSSGGSTGGVLGLALDVKAPAGFDALNLGYRLAYDDPLKQRDYASSRWAANPALLLAQHLRQQLGTVGANSGVAVECLLKVDLQAFSQVFAAPGQSHALLQAQVSLSHKRQLLAERPFVIEQAAPSADANGGVKALVAASSQFGQQLSEWLMTLDKNARLKVCQSEKS